MQALLLTLVATMTLSGCVTVPSEFNVNVDEGDGGGGRQAASGGGNSWREIATDVAGRVFLDGEQGVLFYAFDTLAYPGKPVDLVANVESVEMKSLAGVTVEFRRGEDVIGSAVTDSGGLAKLQWTPPKARVYELTAQIADVPAGVERAVMHVAPAPLIVAAHKRDAKLVVIDLDHTVVDSSFFRVLVGGARPMAGSAEVTRRIAKKYGIVYLTHRPNLLTRKSKTWLSSHGYPPAPLMVSELEQAFGDSGQFKTARLKELREAFPKAAIGIGDKLSDAQAYASNGLTAYLIPHYDRDDPKEMLEMARAIRRLDDRGRLHVVDGWAEIEAGIFEGRKYPPDEYADRLERDADRLRREREWDDDDDDDDDDD